MEHPFFYAFGVHSWQELLPDQVFEKWASLCEEDESEKADPLSQAIRWKVPVLHTSTLGFAPTAVFGWTYPGATSLEPVAIGEHRFWFSVEMDATGEEFAVYYPSAAADGDAIEVLVLPDHCGEHLPKNAQGRSVVPWTHGIPGLCGGVINQLVEMDMALSILRDLDI
jgi:hypothetical protein